MTTDLAQAQESANILIVDDDPMVRVMLDRQLTRLGYQAVQANHGREGLELARRDHPDLMIIDWMMPEMDGPSLCEAIKADPALCHTHLIMLTANHDLEHVTEGLSRGADDFLTKPPNPRELAARIKAGLRVRAITRQVECVNLELNVSYTALAEKQRIVDEDLLSASHFVASLLPEPGELFPGVWLAWKYLPSMTLGGDFFHAVPWGDEHIGIYVIDMSGHGVGPCLRAASLSTYLRTDAVRRLANSFDPGKILTQLSRLCPLESDGQYCTMWLGCLHLPTRRLRFSSAGHPAAVLVKEPDRSELLGLPALPLGFDDDTVYESQEIALTQGDRLYLFSDGIFEIESPAGDVWNREGLERACQYFSSLPLAEAVSQVVDKARVWQQRAVFDDDVVLIGLEINDST